MDRQELIDQYLPDRGEGTTLATQAVTAVVKLSYMWYNNGDVFDNNYYLDGWVNDVSSYANWLYANIDQTKPILERIYNARTEEDYESLLEDLEKTVIQEDFLNQINTKPTINSIYENTYTPFKFTEPEDDDDDDDDY